MIKIERIINVYNYIAKRCLFSLRDKPTEKKKKHLTTVWRKQTDSLYFSYTHFYDVTFSSIFTHCFALISIFLTATIDMNKNRANVAFSDLFNNISKAQITRVISVVSPQSTK